MMRQISQDQYWEISPPYQTLSQLKDILQLAKQYSNVEIKAALQNLQSEYPKYRSIRGDGNCFYRAVAVSYIKSKRLSDFPKIFSELDRLKLTICRPQTIPQCFRQIYNETRIKRYFKNGWVKYFEDVSFENQSQKQQYFRSIINQHWLMDFLIILYFRTLNHRQVNNNWDYYKNFTSNSREKELNNILQYSRQSEGIELFAMTRALKQNILILMVDRYGVTPCLGQNSKCQHFLFFRPGHYDILYNKYQSNSLNNVKSQRVNTFRSNKLISKIQNPKQKRETSYPKLQRTNFGKFGKFSQFYTDEELIDYQKRNKKNMGKQMININNSTTTNNQKKINTQTTSNKNLYVNQVKQSKKQIFSNNKERNQKSLILERQSKKLQEQEKWKQNNKISPQRLNVNKQKSMIADKQKKQKQTIITEDQKNSLLNDEQKKDSPKKVTKPPIYQIWQNPQSIYNFIIILVIILTFKVIIY